ncbi:MAG: hypothetical protein IJS59_04105 [Bacteroidaceae bacterium]|nr:hypothetical protein [Bacteroidaceae bacterium]
MCIDNCIADINAIAAELDNALLIAATIWDDRVATRVNATHINNITDTTRTAIGELTDIAREINTYMDRLLTLTY